MEGKWRWISLACATLAEPPEIPFHEGHLQSELELWVAHYKPDRPHMGLGPAIPAPVTAPAPAMADRHSIPAGHIVRSRPIPGGLQHEYRLEHAA